jgi:hypothetical protein
MLEKALSLDARVSKRAEEINRLLKEDEEIMRPLRDAPNGAALKLEVAQEMVRKMVEGGYWKKNETSLFAEIPIQMKKEKGD